MHAYTFRVVLEDYDDFYADIEVAANQNFEDFHNAIVQLAELKGNEMASFYFCDYSWKRKKEFSLVDLSDPDEEDETAKPLIMKECILAKCIDDPHQRIMYVYDFLKMITFYIELKKISEAQKGIKYPRIIKKYGELPKQGAILPAKFSTEFEDEAPEVFDTTGDFEGEEGEESFDEFGEEFRSESGDKPGDEF